MAGATQKRRAFYVTTPIYYVNDVPHIGHAYTTLACDVLARFHRLDGRPVRFLTGTDEHGQKVAKSAEKLGIAPQEFCDRVSQSFRDLAAAWDFSIDDFIRTTEPRHIKASQALWQRLVASGDIYLDAYRGWYSVRDEAYWAEDELSDDGQGGKLAPTGAPVEWVEEPSYFFRLSAWGERLLAFYEDNPDFILPTSRRNEVLSFVRGGLRDVSISRTTFSWGIPVPGDEAHVMWVWIDALTNYITAAGFPDTESEAWRTWWPADVHMVGKDILRFHAVYWPAFLLAAGLPAPSRVFAHGWWTNEGQKISKSLGNAIVPGDLVQRYGLDQTRYFLMREVPFGQDADFSHKAMLQRVNGDLANDFGNLAQRTLSQIAKNCDGLVPRPGELARQDEDLLARIDGLLDTVREQMEAQEIYQSLVTLWEGIGLANSYIASEAPWSLRKTDLARMATVLWVTAEAIRQLAILVQPVMPGACGRMLDQLGVPPEARSFAHLGPAGRLVPGTPLPEPQGIFPRIVEAA
ncbi:methionine--tRNA ligase [Zavarzinia sp. CC-PAN008]|uniref:methionine--tRNA ligase n=1 Tax=Zavarzinia sp. CC-PAN008 TaxID=3243332 RepID=UPI003F747EA4